MQQKCKSCGTGFATSVEDSILLEKISPTIANKKYTLLSPTHCPACRQQRRYAVRNERHIHWRNCDLTGEKFLSLYSPDKTYKVYKDSVWWGDAWDPMDYGRDIDFRRPFFDQFHDLLLAVPRRGMNQDGSVENSDYTTYGIQNKNCYLAFACAMCEDVYHSTSTYMTKDSVDCLMSGESELLYECTDCKRCYHCFHCHDCSNCNDVYLSEDCRNCTHCIGCKNLRGVEYHLYNKPVSKQVYDAYLARLLASGFEEEAKKFNAWKVQFPCCYAHIQQSEHSTGDYLEGAKNCFDCYDIIRGAEDCRHFQVGGMQCRDCLDCSMLGMNVELLYEAAHSMSCTNSAFLSFCKECSDCYYCDTVRPAKHCFGCTGLRHKEYCILNKQYTKEEYEKLVPRIIEHMQTTGEWGEFFPIRFSPFAYNETVAQDFFPLKKDAAHAKGFSWNDVRDDMPDVAKIIPAAKLPTKIADIPDDILHWAIKCEATGKPFRIIKQELDFYRKNGLSIPHLHPEERHRRRLQLRNPRKLWQRNCHNCKKDISTTYAPDRPEIVYCEECYLQAIHGVAEQIPRTQASASPAS